MSDILYFKFCYLNVWFHFKLLIPYTSSTCTVSDMMLNCQWLYFFVNFKRFKIRNVWYYTHTIPETQTYKHIEICRHKSCKYIWYCFKNMWSAICDIFISEICIVQEYSSSLILHIWQFFLLRYLFSCILGTVEHLLLCYHGYTPSLPQTVVHQDRWVAPPTGCWWEASPWLH